MNVFDKVCVLILASVLLYSAQWSNATLYDYYATTKCLAEPRRSHYGGGIIINPQFRHNIKGWTVFGEGAIREGISKDGNKFIITYNRTGPLDSASQKVHLQRGKIYSFSAWIQVNEGSEVVSVVFRTARGELIHGGGVVAMHKCWSLLKGGMVANFSGTVDLLFVCKNTTIEISVDNVSLQPFTIEQWRSHQDKSINKVRKNNVKFQITFTNKTAVKEAEITIKQKKASFPFGCAINRHIINDTAYQNWFASRFKYTAFTNEMKWYSTEVAPGHENYTVADAMLAFAQKNGVKVRGHNILWDNPKMQPQWVQRLSSSEELAKAVARRIDSIVRKYAGQVIAWDVMNENLHYSFFEDKLGKNASAQSYLRAYQLDPKTRMFMNEFNTIENSGDTNASASKYVKKLEEILSYAENKGLLAGIGVQGHFATEQLNLAYMRATLDTLASTGIPIWLTEVDVRQGPNQAEYLEDVLREGYAHPGVEGIVMWVGPESAGFNTTPLVDKNFKNTPLGDVVDQLIAKLKTGVVKITANSEGFVETPLFHGDYDIIVNHPLLHSSTTFNCKIKEEKFQKTIHLVVKD